MQYLRLVSNLILIHILQLIYTKIELTAILCNWSVMLCIRCAQFSVVITKLKMLINCNSESK